MSLQALYRWTTTGVDGVRLKTKKVGHLLCSCRRWADEFVEEVDRASRSRVRDGEIQSSDERRADRRRAEQAERQKSVNEQLDAAGC